MEPLVDELKDGQWLGVTVRSQGAGGTVMVSFLSPLCLKKQVCWCTCIFSVTDMIFDCSQVCAHRYARTNKDKDFIWGFGLCYTLSQRFDYEYTWEPCKGKPVDK